jgi:hypothetical protein
MKTLLRSPRLSRRRALAALPALLALGLAGCADEAALPIACSGPEACPPPSNSIGWALQVWPASATGSGSDQQTLAPQEIPQLLFDRDGSAEISLHASVQVQGTIATADAQLLARARVLAQLPSAILGQTPYTFDTLSTERPAGAWQLRLPVPARPMEQVYRFWVGFDDATQASQYTPIWKERVLTGPDKLELILPSPSALPAVSGRILDPLGQGVGGMTVQVLDGRGQIVSTTAVSLSSQAGLAGSYRVLVDPSLSTETQPSLTLVARPGAQAGLPVLEAPLVQLKAGSTLPLELRLPSALKPLVFRLPIVGQGPSGALLPVVGARVQAQVVLEDKLLTAGTRAIYTASADTDGEGVAKLSLIPAPLPGDGNLKYSVTVSSPSRTPFASVQQDIQVGPREGELAPVQLALRAQLTGRLLDASGEPVPLAQVVAQPIARTDSTGGPSEAKAVGSTPPQTTTDQDGRFALRLDSGDYDIDFVPQPGTAPRSSLDNQRITSYDVDLGDVRLPRLALGKLVVTGPGGAPLAQAKLRIFQSPDTSPRFGFACQPGLPCSRVAKLRAEAFTDSKGRAQFLLPDSTPAANLQPPPPLQ